MRLGDDRRIVREHQSGAKFKRNVGAAAVAASFAVPAVPGAPAAAAAAATAAAAAATAATATTAAATAAAATAAASSGAGEEEIPQGVARLDEERGALPSYGEVRAIARDRASRKADWTRSHLAQHPCVLPTRCTGE
jgi:hypothetical protein